MVLAGVLVMGVGCFERSPGQRIVLITLDTLRYDSLAAVGGRPSTMPQLERWAEQAAVFEHFYAATAATQPSHASMFTGLHPWQHGVTGNRLRLAESHATVAEHLNEAGYSTAAVVASFPVSQRFGFGQGFGYFDDEFELGTAPGEPGEDPSEEAFYTLADVVTDRALEQLTVALGRRQFFWFHYFDPHSPYGDTSGGSTIQPREVLQLAQAGKDTMEAVRRARLLYDVDVGFLDTALSRLLDRLEEEAEDFETHVVITADHGESFGEEGAIAHGRRLIPSQLHVPCLIRSPRLAAGQRSDVAGSIDIAATLLALAGLEELSGRAESLKGRDLARPKPGSRAFGMRRTWDKPHHDLRLDGSTRLVEGHLFFAVDEHGKLFRGNSQQLEAVMPGDLLEEDSEKIRSLFGRFEQLLSQSQAEKDEAPEAGRALRALGYVD